MGRIATDNRPNNTTMSNTNKPIASRFAPDGHCQSCIGGWLCKDCQGDSAKRERQFSIVLKQVTNNIRANAIARVCQMHELESDEMQSREQKALAYL